MNINFETLQNRISRLNRMVAECPTPVDEPEVIKNILKTAPNVLQDFEQTLRLKNQSELQQLHEVLKVAETNIEWAVGTVKGRVAVEAIKSGKGIDPSLPTDQRLLNRITQFTMTKINGPLYLSLVREFAGEDSVQGTTIHMDPVEESEAFSLWMIHDIKLPGESQRLIDSFAKAEMSKLPPDEQSLLKAHQADRPSIYKVVKMERDPETQGKKDTYLVQDLLSPDYVIRIRDKFTSKSLSQGAIFMGRAIPVDTSSDCLFGVMGSISEYHAKLWFFLSGSIDKWSKEYFEKNPNSTTQDFFRIHHARMRREIRDIISAHSRP